VRSKAMSAEKKNTRSTWGPIREGTVSIVVIEFAR
jgi:hypothetical protein